jgi:hypothetical protein
MAAKEACGAVGTWVGALPNLALGYGMRHSMTGGMAMAVGFSSLQEVHENMRIWRETRQAHDGGEADESRRRMEGEAIRIFEKDQGRNYSWACPI